MRKITLSEYNSTPKDYRGIWAVERRDLPNWAEIHEKHMGKRTMMVYDRGTYLLVEGFGSEIVDGNIWEEMDEVKEEIDSHLLGFYCRQGHEPHYANCTIWWCDTLETEEMRIALAMDSNNEENGEIFFCCDNLENLKSLAGKGREDFIITGCIGFGIYEELLQTA